MSLQDLAGDMVSVTKFCCPVCWELFEVVGKGESVRGCHPIVTPVVLPEILPKDVYEKMITRFRAHLSGQLRHLLVFPVDYTISGLNTHHRNTSGSGYSTTSSNQAATKSSDALKRWISFNGADPARGDPDSKVVPGATL
jgi:hypothetical protein